MKWAEETYFSLRRGKLWPILEQRITQGSLSPFSLDTLLCSPLPRSSAMLLRALDRKKASQPLGSYEWSGIICWHKNPVRQVNMTLFLLLTLFISSSVQSLSHVRLFTTPWIAARQASLSITNSQSLLKLMSIESVMPSNHLILCHPLFLLP